MENQPAPSTSIKRISREVLRSIFPNRSSVRSVGNEERNARRDGVPMTRIELQEPIPEGEEFAEIHEEHFPGFIFGISLLQIILFYSVPIITMTVIFGYDPHRRHELWRYFTWTLVHSDYAHLWDSLEVQIVLGVLTEIENGWHRTAVVYLSSVLGGALFTSVLDSNEYELGSGAGIYGIIFSHLSTLIMNWNVMKRKFVMLFLIVFHIGKDILLTSYVELVEKQPHVSRKIRKYE
ncbi:Protein rhomboid [Pseudolycoriella hygida]|uniref:Protein rhomboid n=1 Tax=Pseudolycoriella hygida TaxID=35572 RepID=A0A9Q0RVA3_9DIPT|nr:Protein rhomboid [Pseudolycoriella hygida]